MITRRNANSLSSSDRAEFVRALKTLKNVPRRFTPPTVSRYDDFVYVHMQAMLLMEIVRPDERGPERKPQDNQRHANADVGPPLSGVLSVASRAALPA